VSLNLKTSLTKGVIMNHPLYNFSPGPAHLPLEVLKTIQKDMLDWNGTGLSILEMPHRGKEFQDLLDSIQFKMRKLINIPENYKILFLQGGAQAMFAFLPMNFTRTKKKLNYLVTGMWSEKAAKQAETYAEISRLNPLTSSTVSLTDPTTWGLDNDAAYTHITLNETIEGIEIFMDPVKGEEVYVADASSTLFSRPMDISRYGVIYASAQKNIGPAGVTLLIIRDDLLEHSIPETPNVYNFKVQSVANSCQNTPPTFNIYVVGLMLDWLNKAGGLSSMYEQNKSQANKLYNFIDESSYYSNPVDPAYRSMMNIPFLLSDASHEKSFLEKATTSGLMNLKGHRLVGGMRASIYNSMPNEGIEALINYMSQFSKEKANV
jgi:phosphoserine aminotransferase